MVNGLFPCLPMQPDIKSITLVYKLNLREDSFTLHLFIMEMIICRAAAATDTTFCLFLGGVCYRGATVHVCVCTYLASVHVYERLWACVCYKLGPRKLLRSQRVICVSLFPRVYELATSLSRAPLPCTYLLHPSIWHSRSRNCSWREPINQTLHFWLLVTKTFIIPPHFCPTPGSNRRVPPNKSVSATSFPFDGVGGE